MRSCFFCAGLGECVTDAGLEHCTPCGGTGWVKPVVVRKGNKKAIAAAVAAIEEAFKQTKRRRLTHG